MNTRKRNGYWTYKNVVEEAQKYSSRSAFSANSQGAYLKARREGWLDLVCGHMKFVTKRMNYWSYEKVSKEAKKYSRRALFKKGSGSAYQKARKEGWLDKICSHMKPPNDGSKYCVYLIMNSCCKKAYVGISKSELNIRIGFHFSSINKTRSQAITGLKGTKCLALTGYSYSRDHVKLAEIHFVEFIQSYGFEILNDLSRLGALGGENKWSFEDCELEAKSYETRYSFSSGSKGAYRKAKKEGWLDTICSHMISKIGTLNSVRKEAEKYKTRTAFARGSSGAYGRAAAKGWLDKVCSHMESGKLPNGYWTKENVAGEAKLAKSRNEFSKTSPYAYEKARREGWLDDVCSHMQGKK